MCRNRFSLLRGRSNRIVRGSSHKCGGKHETSQCRGVRGLCHLCGQPGHFSRACPLMGGQPLSQSQQGSAGGSSQRQQPFVPSQHSEFQPREPSREHCDVLSMQIDSVLGTKPKKNSAQPSRHRRKRAGAAAGRRSLQNLARRKGGARLRALSRTPRPTIAQLLAASARRVSAASGQLRRNSLRELALRAAQPCASSAAASATIVRASHGQRATNDAKRPASHRRSVDQRGQLPAQRLRVVQRHSQPPCATSAHGCRARMRAASWKGRRRKRRWRGRNFDSDFFSISKNKMLDTIMANSYDQIRATMALIPLLEGSGSAPRQAAEEQKFNRDAINTKNKSIICINIHRVFQRVTSLALVPGSNRCFKNPALLG
ncbi:hypothetical protein F511_17685 [Dorcoceras hygrometricum]|uniref:CCHC-type domain-containing protein n=1 Tax=Dorcoceras hygrometricum TaxID=472368 RepID=A0A2Z7C6S8_9LAMI|nr:hypothetical protein F511_17685 [Dorcoceras hygrometricum]